MAILEIPKRGFQNFSRVFCQKGGDLLGKGGFQNGVFADIRVWEQIIGPKCGGRIIKGGAEVFHQGVSS